MKTILLIEDDRLTHESLIRKLNSWGYTSTLSAYDSTEAFELQSRLVAHLLLVDIDLPGRFKNGVELVETLRMNGDQALVIYLSGLQDEGLIARATKTDPLAVLHKSMLDAYLKANIELAFHTTIKPAHAPGILNDVVFVPSTEGHVRVLLSDIVWLEAGMNTTTLYMKNGTRHCISTTFGRYLDGLPMPNEILRVHKSYAVNVGHIHKVVRQDKHIYLKDASDPIKIGETYMKSVMVYLGIKSLG